MRKIGFIAVLVVCVALIFTQLRPKPAVSPKPSEKSDSNLSRAVDSAMNGAQSTYGIVIKNFKTKEAYFSNEKREFVPGSLYKLWVAKEAYKRVANGELKIDDEITENIADLNNYYGISDEEAEFTEGVYSMTVGEAINQMITISHNNSALALAKKLGMKNTLAVVTPLQVANFFEDLYAGKMVNATFSGQLLTILKKQENKDMISKLLPDGVVVAHKTGNVATFMHDAGIVYSPKGDYILVVLSDGDFPPGAKDRIAKVSKAVFDFFMAEPSTGGK